MTKTLLVPLVLAIPETAAVASPFSPIPPPPDEGVNARALVAGRGPLLRLEIGAESARTRVDATSLKHPEGSVVLPGSGEVDTRGVTVRMLAGPSRLYMGAELGYGQVSAGPALMSPYALRTQTPQDSSGSSVTIAFPFGVQGSAGRVIVGAEAAIGWRRMSLAEPNLDESVRGWVPMLEARARAGVWVTPTISVAAIFGTGLVVTEATSASLVLGFSRFPWDGDR